MHPSLLSLSLQRFKLADELLPILSTTSPSLKSLNLTSSSLSDNSLLTISTLTTPLPNLIDLNISKTRITSRGVHICLQLFTNLEQLDVSYLDLTLPMVNFPSSNLNSLILEGTELDQDNFEQLLLSSKKLKNVIITNNQPAYLSSETIHKIFFSLQEMKKLTTRNIRITLPSLCRNLTLLSLTLVDNPIDAYYLCNNFTSLEELVLEDCKIVNGASSLGLVYSMPKLTNLSLVRTTFILNEHNTLEGQELVQFVGSLDRLKSVDFTHSDIFPNHIEMLFSKTNIFILEHLNLQSCYRVDGEIIDFIENVISKRKGRCEIDLRYCFNVHRTSLIHLARKLSIENINHGVTVVWA